MPRDAAGFAARYGPWALVAGASEGLGAAYAEALAKRGLDLVLVARRREALETVRQHLADTTGRQVRCLCADLSNGEAVAALPEQLDDLDIGLLVYNAALAPGGVFLDQPLPAQEAAVATNVQAPLRLAHHFGQAMRARGHGGLIFMSSLTAFQGSPFVATYGATKAFNLALAEALWFELSPHGVDVLGVCAGATRTPGYQKRVTRPAPGELEPAQVVAEALAQLGRGPILIPGHFNRFASFVMRRLLSRQRTIRLMGEQTRALEKPPEA